MPIYNGGLFDHSWGGYYRNPAHAGKPDKPIAELHRPHSNLREHDWAQRHGHGATMMGQEEINHFIFVPEIAPYVQSYSTRDCCLAWYGPMMVGYLNQYIGRHAAGGINSFNPRTKWAQTIVFWTGLVRWNIAWLIGCCGYFYSYEFLYTHVPPFKIRDPSPEGWKRCLDDGQTTYGARYAASIFPAMAHAFYTGGLKKTGFWFMFTCYWSLYYELSRPVFMGSILGLNFLNYQENDRHGRTGSLTPELERRIDPDTNRPFWIAQYENFRLSHNNELMEDLWKVGHDYQPLREQTLKMRNPYFNWQKSPQLNRDAKLRYKSQLFKLPEVLEARMIAGAYDRDVHQH